MSKYIYFWGHRTSKPFVGKECMSQWYQSKFIVDGVEYLNGEQYMMAGKALLFKDKKSFNEIMTVRNADPKIIKSLGRGVKNFDGNLWDKHKYEIVVKGNYHKFVQNDELKKYLLSTEDKILVEASPFDKVWGVGLSATDPLIKNENTWQGLNLLGKALMDVRNDIYYGQF